MHFFKNIKFQIIFIVLLCIVLPTVFYIVVFGKNGLSNKNENWSAMSTFISGFITLANLIIFSILTISIHDYNLKKDTQSQRIESLTNRPLLSFIKRTEDTFYSIENIGKGSALNIILRGHLHDSKWEQAYLFYALGPANIKPLKWTYNCNKIMAEYYDVLGNKYVSFMDADTLRVIDFGDPKSLIQFADELQMSNSDSVKPTWPV